MFKKGTVNQNEIKYIEEEDDLFIVHKYTSSSHAYAIKCPKYHALFLSNFSHQKDASAVDAKGFWGKVI